MFDFLSEYKSEITTVCISVVASFFATLLTHFLGYFKLRFTEKLKISSQVSSKKYEGIAIIREKIHILSQHENLCITEDEDTLIPENRGGKVYTPACCYSYDVLCDTTVTFNSLLSEYGDCLSHTSAIQMCYVRNFLLDYYLKCIRAGITDELLRWVSVPLYKGIRKWFKLLERGLIRELNKPSLKYYAHSGLKYNIMLKIYGLYFYRTEPYKYLNDKSSLLNLWIENPDSFMEEAKKIRDSHVQASNDISELDLLE